MINQVMPQRIQKPQKSRSRYLNIKYSGYVALTLGSACGISGLKSVKIPHKAKFHKYCGYLAGLASFWHLGAIKHWDKIFEKKSPDA